MRYAPGGMNARIQTSLDRLHTYLRRLERDLEAGDRNEALANVAELGEISRRLWNVLAETGGSSIEKSKVTIAEAPIKTRLRAF